jgi:hypothetical protein
MLQDKAKEMTTRKRTARGQMGRFGNDFIEPTHRALRTGIARSFLMTLGRRLLSSPTVEQDHAAITANTRFLFFLFCVFEKPLWGVSVLTRN